MERVNNNLSFYYTFGILSQFPYQEGWVRVEAANRQEADSFFRLRFPDVHKGFLNCDSIYTEDQFQNLGKFVSGTKGCHEVITRDSLISRGLIAPVRPRSLDTQIQMARSRKQRPSVFHLMGLSHIR